METLYVYDTNRIRIGEISEFVTLEIERNYFDVSKILLRVEFDERYVDLLKNGNYLEILSDFNRLYIIEHFSKVTEGELEIIEVFAYSLNSLLKYRAIPQQQRYLGTVSFVMNSFIRNNCITTSPERVIPGLSVGPNISGPTIDSSKSGGSVFEQVFALGRDYGYSIDLLSNHDNASLYTYIYEGKDRSINQFINSSVIFSQQFDNVLQSVYYESLIDYKNVAVVAGQGEGLDRRVVTVGNYSGLDRRELYVDARDLSMTYTDENNNQITLTEQQYDDLLRQRGTEYLADNIAIRTFESVVDDNQFTIWRDYFLGDIVTFIDESLGIQIDARVVSVKTVINREGTIVTPSFGTGIPRKLF